MFIIISSGNVGRAFTSEARGPRFDPGYGHFFGQPRIFIIRLQFLFYFTIQWQIKFRFCKISVIYLEVKTYIEAKW